MEFDDYRLDAPVYDEMFLPDGVPREHSQELYEALRLLTAEELSSIQERVTRSFSTEGITFTVYGTMRPTSASSPSIACPACSRAPIGGTSRRD